MADFLSALSGRNIRQGFCNSPASLPPMTNLQTRNLHSTDSSIGNTAISFALMSSELLRRPDDLRDRHIKTNFELDEFVFEALLPSFASSQNRAMQVSIQQLHQTLANSHKQFSYHKQRIDIMTYHMKVHFNPIIHHI